MPLFMDYHQFDHVTIEDVKNAHIADIAIQNKYGVKYHQFWVNEEAGTVFCLMEGPDKETCAMVHHFAHGNVACAITEVEPGFYKLALGLSIKSESGMVKHVTGDVDTGYRSVLVVSVRGITHARNSEDLQHLLIPIWAKLEIVNHFEKYGGREITRISDDSLIAIFDNITEAVQCTKSIRQVLIQGNTTYNPGVIFKMGLSAGQPVTEDGDFFNKVLKLSHRLCNAAGDNQVFVAPLIRRLCKDPAQLDTPYIKCMAPADELFLTKLLSTIEENLSNEAFTIQNLSSSLGISRPQLYRKIISITGKSPNTFIRDIRMQKAFFLFREKLLNVSEVALQVGFTNPSYFAKCFHKKYGYLPSKMRS